MLEYVYENRLYLDVRIVVYSYFLFYFWLFYWTLFMNIKDSLQNIQDIIDQKDILLNKLEIKNSQLIKVLSTIRQQLERSLKNSSLLNDAVYQSIDLCRANLVFLDYSTGTFKQDFPLTVNEKVLPFLEKNHEI